jgi:hypothetical protein
MFVRKKRNPSGIVSVQVIDKSTGRYKLLKTTGSSKEESAISSLVPEGKRMDQLTWWTDGV